MHTLVTYLLNCQKQKQNYIIPIGFIILIKNEKRDKKNRVYEFQSGAIVFVHECMSIYLILACLGCDGVAKVSITLFILSIGMSRFPVCIDIHTHLSIYFTSILELHTAKENGDE